MNPELIILGRDLRTLLVSSLTIKHRAMTCTIDWLVDHVMVRLMIGYLYQCYIHGCWCWYRNCRCYCIYCSPLLKPLPKQAIIAEVRSRSRQPPACSTQTDSVPGFKHGYCSEAHLAPPLLQRRWARRPLSPSWLMPRQRGYSISIMVTTVMA